MATTKIQRSLFIVMIVDVSGWLLTPGLIEILHRLGLDGNSNFFFLVISGRKKIIFYLTSNFQLKIYLPLRTSAQALSISRSRANSSSTIGRGERELTLPFLQHHSSSDYRAAFRTVLFQKHHTRTSITSVS